jgi:hypothetical protein
LKLKTFSYSNNEKIIEALEGNHTFWKMFWWQSKVGGIHYFKIDFPQIPGSLKNFILNVLGQEDDIIYFRYTRLINKDLGPVIIGIQTKRKNDVQNIIQKMSMLNIKFDQIKDDIYI